MLVSAGEEVLLDGRLKNSDLDYVTAPTKTGRIIDKPGEMQVHTGLTCLTTANR